MNWGKAVQVFANGKKKSKPLELCPIEKKEKSWLERDNEMMDLARRIAWDKIDREREKKQNGR